MSTSMSTSGTSRSTRRAPPSVIRASDPAAAMSTFVDALEGDEVVLVKGSRGARLERVIDHLDARFGGRA